MPARHTFRRCVPPHHIPSAPLAGFTQCPRLPPALLNPRPRPSPTYNIDCTPVRRRAPAPLPGSGPSPPSLPAPRHPTRARRGGGPQGQHWRAPPLLGQPQCAVKMICAPVYAGAGRQLAAVCVEPGGSLQGGVAACAECRPVVAPSGDAGGAITNTAGMPPPQHFICSQQQPRALERRRGLPAQRARSCCALKHAAPARADRAAARGPSSSPSREAVPA